MSLNKEVNALRISMIEILFYNGLVYHILGKSKKLKYSRIFRTWMLFSVPTQLYYWHLHVSSFKKRSIFVNSDRHIHLLVRNLLSNQVELNPGPQSLDDSSYPCSLFVPNNVHGILMQLYVTTVTNDVILDVLT
jgi:hypothetical protein